jgi:hypothetical protein
MKQNIDINTVTASKHVSYCVSLFEAHNYNNKNELSAIAGKLQRVPARLKSLYLWGTHKVTCAIKLESK